MMAVEVKGMEMVTADASMTFMAETSGLMSETWDCLSSCSTKYRYWVWDDYQADFIRRVATGNPQTLIVGPIWFSGTADHLPTTERAVAVFDVTPLRDTRYCSLGLDIEFYTPATTNKFLKDISDATSRRHGRVG